MPDYQQGKIYRVVCDTTGLCYYGSTTQPLISTRLATHTRNYKKYLNSKYHYVSAFDVLQNSNYKIFLVETHPCNTKMELEMRERFFIENNDCVNKHIPTRTQHENYENNKEVIKEKVREFRKNSPRITCECGSVISKYDISKHNQTSKHLKYFSI